MSELVRIQISLDAETHRRAKRKAAELGISLAEYLKMLVVRDDRGATGAADVRQVFALGDSGGSDMARHKDAYLAEAAEQNHL